MINAASSQLTETISAHAFAEVIENKATNQRSLHATQPFQKEELICLFSAGNTFLEPNFLTIQTGVDRHITLVPEFLQYCNHSCDPNVFFDTTTMQVFALKDIHINDELCFFYPSTELDMAQPFVCYCGSGRCLQNIKGASHLHTDILSGYQLTDFIQQQLKNL